MGGKWIERSRMRDGKCVGEQKQAPGKCWGEREGSRRQTMAERGEDEGWGSGPNGGGSKCKRILERGSPKPKRILEREGSFHHHTRCAAGGPTAVATMLAGTRLGVG